MLETQKDIQARILAAMIENDLDDPVLVYTTQDLARDLAYELSIQGIPPEMIGKEFILELLTRTIEKVKKDGLKIDSQVSIAAYGLISDHFFERKLKVCYEQPA